MALSATIDGARCVHSRVEVASCRACAQACPRGAVVLTDEALDFQSTECDGCGLCRSACPQQAIDIAPRPLVVAPTPARPASVLMACASTGLDGEGVVPCLHAFGLADVLRAWDGGVRQWVLASGDCAACARGQRPAFAAAVAAASALLTDRGCEPVAMARCTPQEWGQRRAAVRDIDPGAGRRSFLRRMVGGQSSSPALQRIWAPQATPPQVLRRGRGRLPFALTMDGTRCTGCDACVHVCPTHALRLDIPAQRYVIDSAACNGCRVCLDVCDIGAVAVLPMQEPQQQGMELTYHRCPACKADFHRPAQQAATLCTVCEKVDHRRHLHQRLD
jgi:ferredoxin